MNRLILIVVFLLQPLLFYAQGIRRERIDSLLENLKHTDAANRMELFQKLALEYLDNNPDTAIYYERQALVLAERDKNEKQIAYSRNMIGEMHLSKSEYITAMRYFNQALRGAQDIDYKREIGTSYNNIAYVYSVWGNGEKALEYYLKALEFSLQAGTAQEIIIAYNNVGGQYIDLRNYKKALEYFDKALILAKNNGSKPELALVYGNMATCYMGMEQYDQALVNYEKSHELYLTTNDYNGLIVSLYNMGLLYVRLGDYPKASACATEMEKYELNLEHKSARNYLLSMIYDSLRNYKLAFQYHKQAVRAKDSVFNAEKFATLSRMQAEYNNREQQAENQQLRTQIDEALSNKQWYERISLSMGLLLLVAISFLLYLFISNKNKRKRNRQLKAQNKIITEQNEELESQREKIEEQKQNLEEALKQSSELMQFKTNMTSMLVHDLKNPLNAVLGMSELMPDRIEEAREQLKLIQRSGSQMLNLVNNILDVERFESAHITLSQNCIGVKTIVQICQHEMQFLLSERHIALKTELQEGLQTYADQTLVERILTNMLSNAVKYSPEYSQVTIRAYQTDDNMVSIEVIDTGIGIKAENLDHIFDKFTKFTSSQEASRKSTGIGLTFCKMAVEAHGGTIGVKSTYQQGSTFWFTLPRC